MCLDRGDLFEWKMQKKIKASEKTDLTEYFHTNCQTVPHLSVAKVNFKEN